MSVREGPIERPDLERYSDNPLFNTKAVVQQTGVPAPTLRAWENRYAILRPERADNAYRLYSERDIALIRWLKERVDSGMAISQAIALWRHLEEEYREAKHLQSAQELPARLEAPAFQIAHPSSLSAPLTVESAGSITLDHERADDLASAPTLHTWPPILVDQMCSAYPSVHNMHIVSERLIGTFKTMDETQAQRLLSSMLAVYSVEQICAELITPTMWQVGRLWEQGVLGVAEEHFASQLFRGLLTNLLYIALGQETGPLAIVCCAPGEAHELAPLMLALLLRRAGMRVLYLGQSVETTSLLDAIRRLEPALLCVSITMSAYLAALVDLGQQLQELPAPRPVLVFGGRVFNQHPHLAAHVPAGIYLSGDLPNVVGQLRRIACEQTQRSSESRI